MRESEGGTLKHTYSTFILETQRKADQQRDPPIHPIFSAGRAKPLSTSPGSPNVFTTRSTTTTHTITDRVFIHLNSLLTTATGARRVRYYGAGSSSSSIGGCGRCKTHVGVYTTRGYAHAYAYAAQSDTFETWM